MKTEPTPTQKAVLRKIQQQLKKEKIDLSIEDIAKFAGYGGDLYTVFRNKFAAYAAGFIDKSLLPEGLSVEFYKAAEKLNKTYPHPSNIMKSEKQKTPATQTVRTETVEIRYVMIRGKEVAIISPGRFHDQLKELQIQVEDALSGYITLDSVNADLMQMLGEGAAFHSEDQPHHRQ